MIDYRTNLECPNCHHIGESTYISSVGDYVCEMCGEWHECLRQKDVEERHWEDMATHNERFCD